MFPIMVSASFIFPYQKENRFKGLASHAKLKPLSLLISLLLMLKKAFDNVRIDK